MNNELIIKMIDKRIYIHSNIINDYKLKIKNEKMYEELIYEHEAVLKELRLLKLDIQNI